VKIRLNKREAELQGSGPVSVKRLLAEKKFVFPLIVVRVNGKLIKKQDYASTRVCEGDSVEAFHLTSGG
jgi:sulfur carrier protein